MSVQPMIAYMSVVGLGWAVGALNRKRKIGDVIRRCTIAIVVFVVICVGTSFPRLARNAFYYSYAAHIGQYYETIRSRAFIDLPGVEQAVREACPADGVIVANENQLSILHFLTERVIVGTFPEPAWPVADDLEAVRSELQRAPESRCAVIDFSSIRDQAQRQVFLDGLDGVVTGEYGGRAIYRGESFIVYALSPAQADEGRPPSGPCQAGRRVGLQGTVVCR